MLWQNTTFLIPVANRRTITRELFNHCSAEEKVDVRSDYPSGLRDRPWLRFAVTAALIAAGLGPMLALLDWVAIQHVQALLPGPPSEPLGWGWAFGIAGASGLALAAHAEWKLRRGGRRLAAPDAEPAAADVTMSVKARPRDDGR
jgi:hypothetical protein